MPDKVYAPRHAPPSWADRALTHPVVILAIWSVLAGVGLVVAALVPSFRISESVASFPFWLTLPAGVGMAVGGLLSAWGLLTGHRLSILVESGGWWLIGLAWAAYGAFTGSVFPLSVLAWGTSLAIVWTAATRIRAIIAILHNAREAQRRIEAQKIAYDGGREPPS